jgi:Colicin V production protein/Domain of unknown function (DUF4124)
MSSRNDLMLTDFICVLLVSLLFWAGWRKGLLTMLLSVVSLAAAYAATWLLFRPVGRGLGDLLDLQPILALPLGGVTVFVVVLIVATILALMVRRRIRARWARRQGGPGWLRWVDRLGGGLFGASYGAAVVLLVVWATLMVQGLLPGWGPQGLRQSMAGRLATPFAERFAGAMASETSGSPAISRVAAHMARDPAGVTKDLEAVLSDRRLLSLFNDRRLARAVKRGGDVGQLVASHRAVAKLSRDPDFVARASRLGLLQEGPAGLSPEEVQRQLADHLTPMARAVQGLARDPEVKRLLSDELLVLRLEQRDVWALANDPKFNRLAELVLMRLRAEAPGGQGAQPPRPRYDEPSATVELKAPGSVPPGLRGRIGKGKMFRWRDKRGRWHYSDQPPQKRIRYEEVKVKP